MTGTRGLLCFLCIVVALTLVPGNILGQEAPPAQQPTLADISWLAGCWEAASGRTSTQEQWMEPRGGTMLGMNRTVKDDQTRGHELLILRASESGLVYEAHPSGQATAEFKSTDARDGMIRFENPEHDFPRRITYMREGTDSLVAWVDDGQDGGGFDIRFQRVRCP